jgi:hypothetical protein
MLLSGLLLTACGSGKDPAKVVEHYLAAKVAQDEDTLHNLLCSQMEGSLEMELLSFASANDATIVDMRCSQRENINLVDCTGSIILSYGEEQNEFPLGTYRVVEEDDVWKWCGEAP